MKKLYSIFVILLFTVAAHATMPEAGPDIGGGEPFLKEFSVYPNPSSGKITVSFSAVAADQNLTLKVYNLIGQEIQNQSVTTFNGLQNIEVNLSELPKGMYMVELSNGKSSRIKRISII